MKKTHVVLAGCGGISGAWLGSDTVKRRVKIVGLVDIQPSAAESAKEKFDLRHAVTGRDLDAVLRRTAPDAVFDCSVPEAHCSVTLTALKHGCHVLGEKPMSDSMPNARRMTAAAQRAGKTYAVMQNRRYLRGIRALRRFIESGAIGELDAVHGDFFIGAHFGGFRDVMEHVLLLDMAIHAFDQTRFITGEDAVAVYCHEWTPRHSWYRSGPSAAAIFEMTHGVVYSYRGSWCAEGCPTPWECTWRIIGRKGTVLWQGGDDFRCEIVSGTRGFVRPVRAKNVPINCPQRLCQGHDSAIALFLNAIRDGETPETVCTDNVKSLAMVHGALKSATSGRRTLITRQTCHPTSRTGKCT